MFFREKKSQGCSYLQVVESFRDEGKVKQRVLWNVGRLDVLKKSGHIDALLRSGLRFAERLQVFELFEGMDEEGCQTLLIGPDLLFASLWERLGIRRVIRRCLRERRFDFDVERAIYLTVLHRLFESGSDRAATRWMRDVFVPGAEDLELHHLYRAMAFWGEETEASVADASAPYDFRCMKDRIEEALFFRRRDLFSGLSLVFFDTTSLYFEGNGGENLGRRGYSKDHRSDLKQMVVGAVLDDQGYPICCEMWPGNTADVKSLLPIAKRLGERFGIAHLCLVADRGMIAAKTLEKLESANPPCSYILGARMRLQKEVCQNVLSRPGAYREVTPQRSKNKDPSPLKVKEVWVEDRRYILCLNEEQRRKDAHDREQILASLRQQLNQGEKQLVGNKGYRKYLKTQGKNNWKIDEEKIKCEARFDGKWVLRSNLDRPAEEIALKYKELWQVEHVFRTMKSSLETRPIYHKCDETIRGHVFCSFLALMLRKSLEESLIKTGKKYEWKEILRDINEVQEITAHFRGKKYIMRSKLQGCAYNVLRSVGVKAPPALREG